MRKVRLLVVDDSLVFRTALAKVLGALPWIEVVGTAEDGPAALRRISELSPDLVTLDMQMPGMNGLEVLGAVRKRRPGPRVIMCSALTHPGAVLSVEALLRGADDYFLKPEGFADGGKAVEALRAALVPKILALFPNAESGAAPEAPPMSTVRAGRGTVAVVVVGVSTGGPNALAMLLPALPPGLAVPVLIVQHMPAVFTSILAQRLSEISAIPVAEAAPGDRLSPGKAWLAPGGFDLTVARGEGGFVLRTGRVPTDSTLRPSADVLFRSAAEAFGSGVLAVVLTGMGNDGLAGCRAVRAAGGSVIAQDRDTSLIWGMPGAVAGAGLADAVLPLDRIGPEIGRRAGRAG